ncbi:MULTISPECIES: DUF6328 family protein [Kitasatospora]|uniref:Integral membrane protein n=1 Tax=Kitasatospora setae (strain ATCC 33774 / DSM 43861 / JCM 3304 / KCC A-0304 / NBRC 14216 / KM-6054) TaxID=452652 RepID=E4NC93_KITSK|nr:MULTISPECIES: DUF6328 family protein [Kitasatospora]BAJ28824.1 hypothetical protein KSE_30120 [Kitasatospora setae KM-6054]
MDQPPASGPDPAADPADGPDPAESPQARANRRLVEMLQELRVLQTGVQIVFAFLLGVAFTPGFAGLGAGEQDLYVAVLLLTVLAAAVLATPVALHRALLHHPERPRILRVSARIAQIGLVLLAAALSGAVLLVLTVVLGAAVALPLTGAVALAFTGLWFVLPWAVRRSLPAPPE